MIGLQGIVKNGYKFEKRLGIGAFGEVWQASKEGKTFAIKKIEKEKAGSEENFVKNVKLPFPFLVQYLDIFHEEIEGHSYVYLVMEYCAHGNLSTLTKVGLKTPKLIRLFIQLGIGLYILDQNHIIHRDIKLENILLDEKDDLKLADFGSARMLSNTLSKTSAFNGTIPYMSPQVVQGQQYGPKTDVWSMGVVMYELCTQKKPFDAPSELMIPMLIVEKPLAQIAPSDTCPPELAAIIHSMLAKIVAFARRPDVDMYRFFPSGLRSLIDAKEEIRILKHEVNKREGNAASLTFGPVYVQRKFIRIMIKTLNGKFFYVEADSEDTCAALKQKIQKELYFPTDGMNLAFVGKLLRDDILVKDAGLVENSAVVMFIKKNPSSATWGIV